MGEIPGKSHPIEGLTQGLSTTGPSNPDITEPSTLGEMAS